MGCQFAEVEISRSPLVEFFACETATSCADMRLQPAYEPHWLVNLFLGRAGVLGCLNPVDAIQLWVATDAPEFRLGIVHIHSNSLDEPSLD